jgi:hypothetical protein
MAEASRLISTCWPRPVSCLWLSAARMADGGVQAGDHVEHRHAGPVRLALGSPVTLISPEGLDDEVVPGQCGTLGPLPKPLIEAYTTAGLAAETES